MPLMKPEVSGHYYHWYDAHHCHLVWSHHLQVRTSRSSIWMVLPAHRHRYCLVMQACRAVSIPTHAQRPRFESRWWVIQDSTAWYWAWDFDLGRKSDHLMVFPCLSHLHHRHFYLHHHHESRDNVSMFYHLRPETGQHTVVPECPSDRQVHCILDRV